MRSTMLCVEGDDTNDTIRAYQHSPPERPTESSLPRKSGNNDDDSIPQSFRCPLTFEVMADPVLDSEGNNFERKALLKWLQKSHLSPVSRQNLNDNALVPNIALRDMIHNAMGEEWIVSRRAELDVEFGPSHPANASLSIHTSKYRKVIDSHLERVSQEFGSTLQLDEKGICAFVVGDQTMVIEVPETLGHFFIYSSKYVPSLSESTKDRILELNYMQAATRGGCLSTKRCEHGGYEVLFSYSERILEVSSLQFKSVIANFIATIDALHGSIWS